jgi:hypothetical protein
MYPSQNLSLKFKSVLEISYHKTTELIVPFDYQMEFTIWWQIHIPNMLLPTLLMQTNNFLFVSGLQLLATCLLISTQ